MGPQGAQAKSRVMKSMADFMETLSHYCPQQKKYSAFRRHSNVIKGAIFWNCSNGVNISVKYEPVEISQGGRNYELRGRAQLAWARRQQWLIWGTLSKEMAKRGAGAKRKWAVLLRGKNSAYHQRRKQKPGCALFPQKIKAKLSL